MVILFYDLFKKFLNKILILIDFDAKFFWKWTDFTSYLQFLIFFIGVGSLFTWLLINSTAFIEILGKLFMEKNFLKYKFLV